MSSAFEGGDPVVAAMLAQVDDQDDDELWKETRNEESGKIQYNDCHGYAEYAGGDAGLSSQLRGNALDAPIHRAFCSDEDSIFNRATRKNL